MHACLSSIRVIREIRGLSPVPRFTPNPFHHEEHEAHKANLSGLDARCWMFDVERWMLVVPSFCPLQSAFCLSKIVQRTASPRAGFLHHMRVNLRRFQALVPEQFLQATKIRIPSVQQVGGETMPQRVAADRFIDLGQTRRDPHRPLHRAFIGVMTPDDPAARIFGQPPGGKDPHPSPFLAGLGILAFQCSGEHDPRHAIVPVGLPQQPHSLQVLFDRIHQSLGEHHHPVLGSFSLADQDLPSIKLQVLDSQLLKRSVAIICSRQCLSESTGEASAAEGVSCWG